MCSQTSMSGFPSTPLSCWRGRCSRVFIRCRKRKYSCWLYAFFRARRIYSAPSVMSPLTWTTKDNGSVVDTSVEVRAMPRRPQHCRSRGSNVRIVEQGNETKLPATPDAASDDDSCIKFAKLLQQQIPVSFPHAIHLFKCAVCVLMRDWFNKKVVLSHHRYCRRGDNASGQFEGIIRMAKE